jgi:hypothetical protein
VVTILSALTISTMTHPNAFVEYDVHLAAVSVSLPAQARLVISTNVPLSPRIHQLVGCMVVVSSQRSGVVVSRSDPTFLEEFRRLSFSIVVLRSMFERKTSRTVVARTLVDLG